MQIPAISISVQRMCGREIREVKVDGKSVELIADEEFLLLYALSFKKKKRQSAGVSVFEPPQE